MKKEDYDKKVFERQTKQKISIGDKFGELTVVDSPSIYTKKNDASLKSRCTAVNCVCSCGRESLIQVRSLLKGRTKSCGCFRKKLMREPRKNNKSTQLNNDSKRCSSCLSFKTKKDFFNDSRNKDRLTVACKECHYFSSIKRKYKISKDDFFKLFNKNNEACYICNKKLIIADKLNYPCVDHCHETNKVRGILCKKCNKSLHRSITLESIDRAIEYIRRGKFVFTNENTRQYFFKFNKKKEYTIRYRYKCSIENLNEMINFKNAKCHICESNFSSQKDLSIDHNHTSGEIRGILCNSCNYFIGGFNESIDIILSAKKYLQDNSSPST